MKLVNVLVNEVVNEVVNDPFWQHGFKAFCGEL